MIKILDCTFQEGGYLNNWHFADNDIELRTLLADIVNTHVDIIDIGVLELNSHKSGRSIFNSTEEVIHILPNKRDIYVLSYRGNLLELQNLKFTNRIKYIRVFFEYNMNINELKEICYFFKKYEVKIIIQIKCISLYNIEEIHKLLKLICDIDVYEICVEDTFGGLTQEKFLKIMNVITEKLKPKIVIGYRGCNAQIPVENILNDLLLLSENRQVVIESSFCGIGRGMGLYDTTKIMQFLNINYNRGYYIKKNRWITDKLIKSVNNQVTWGYEEILYRIANRNCSYEYAPIFRKENATDKEIEYVLSGLKKLEQLIPNEDVVKDKLRKYRKTNTFCIVVPTANRKEVIKNYLAKKIFNYRNFGIDLIVYDSSNDDETKKVVKTFIDAGADNLFYSKYTGKYDGSLDEKLIAAYKEYWDKYEYIWICRDGLIINIESCYHDLLELMNKKYDLVIVDNKIRDIQNSRNKEYTDSLTLFKDQCIRMVTLGTMILSSAFAKCFVKTVPIDSLKNWTLWQVIGLFQYAALIPVRAYCYCGNVFLYNEYSTLSSFWNSNGKALWQWGERWFNVINELPDIYNDEKKSMYKIRMYDFNPFGIKQLLIIRGNYGLNFEIIKNNRKYIKYVTETELWMFILIACIPPVIARVIVNCNERLTGKILNKTWSKLNNIFKKDIFPNYYTNGNYFDSIDVSCLELMWESNTNEKKKYAFIVFVDNSNVSLEDTLESICNQECKEKKELIIIDGTKSESNIEIAQKYKECNISYYKLCKRICREEQYNISIEVCNADWVVFLKNGNILKRNYINSINSRIDFYQRRKNIGMIWNRYAIYNSKEDLSVLNIKDDNVDRQRLERLSRVEYRLFGNIRGFYIDCGAILNCDAVKDQGGFCPNQKDNSILIFNYNLMKKYAVYVMDIETAYCYSKNRRCEVVFESNVNEILENIEFRKYICKDFIWSRVWLDIFKNQFVLKDIVERLTLPQYYIRGENYEKVYQLTNYKKNKVKERFLYGKFGVSCIYYKIKKIITALKGNWKFLFLDTRKKIIHYIKKHYKKILHYLL